MFAKFVVGAVLAVVSVTSALAVHVDGYYRSNGTYVGPYERTAPDGDTNNNWSTRGNVNPYTGQLGVKPSFNPYVQPEK